MAHRAIPGELRAPLASDPSHIDVGEVLLVNAFVVPLLELTDLPSIRLRKALLSCSELPDSTDGVAGQGLFPQGVALASNA